MTLPSYTQPFLHNLQRTVYMLFTTTVYNIIKENSFLKQPKSIIHCISGDAKMSGGFAELFLQRFPCLRNACRRARLSTGQVFPFWDEINNRFIYNLVSKLRYSEKPELTTLYSSLEAMKSLSSLCGIPTIAIPKIECGLDQIKWQEVVILLRDVFSQSDVRIVVFTLEENGVHGLYSGGDPDFYAEDEIQRYSEDFYLNNRDLETDFTRHAKSYQPTCDENFPTFLENEYNNHFIEHCLQYHPRKLVHYVKEFDMHFSITDEEMILLMDMLIDSRDV